MSTLIPESVSRLQELIQANIDSRNGFRHAAGATEDLTLEGVFEQLAQERESQIADLSSFVSSNGQLPKMNGSVSAAISRAWLTIREALVPEDREAILLAMESSEESLLTAYEFALETEPNLQLADVLAHHSVAVRAACNRIRALRESLR